MEWEDEWVPPPLVPRPQLLGMGWLVYAKYEAEMLRQWNRDLIIIRQALHLKEDTSRTAA